MKLFRYTLLAGALASAGCATWSRTASPHWSVPGAAPSGLPGSLSVSPPTGTGNSLGAGSGAHTTNRPPSLTPTPASPPASGPGRTPPGRAPTGGATSTPPPYRPEAADDDLMRKPFSRGTRDQTPPPRSEEGAADSPTSPRPFPLRIPAPEAGAAPQGAQSTEPHHAWQVRSRGDVPPLRSEQSPPRTASAGSLPSAWRTIGRSSGGRPIEVLQLGSGDRHLFLTASLAGNERDSVTAVAALAELLAREPQRLAGCSLLLVRTPNPDGLAEGTLTNARGVSLNRNFPSENFLGRRTTETGLAPASEPETQTLLALLDDFRPDRVIHFRSGNSQRMLVLANAPAADLLRERKDPQWMDAGEFEAFKAGSLEEFTHERLRAELLVVWLPASVADWEATSRRLADLLLDPPSAAVEATAESVSPQALSAAPASVPPKGASTAPAPSPPQRSRSTPDDLFAPYETPARLTGQVEFEPPAAAAAPPVVEPPRGKRGYVEILPPPPEFAETDAGLNPRYYELAPPPEE